MSLIKVPLLLSAVYLFAVGIAPPPSTPPANKEETSKAPADAQKLNFRLQITYGVTSAGVLAFCECLYILASQYPSFPYASDVTYALNKTSTPANTSTTRLNTLCLLGWVTVFMGRQIRHLCYRTLGRFFTFDIAIRSNHRLVTAFPYSVVRHPAYVGSCCAFIGMALCVLSPGAWVWENGWWEGSWLTKAFLAAFMAWEVSAIVFLVRRIEVEDRMMKEEFGKEWEEWAGKVRWKMIPGVF